MTAPLPQQLALALALHERLKREQMKLRDKAIGDYYTFFRYFAWPVLEPRTPYADNWHIGAMCEHLQAVTLGQITRLIINLPFRMLKSTCVSQAWPAWEWISSPHVEYLTGGYSKDLATRDAVNSRRIIESDGYQAAFGDRFAMTSDQNVKTRYENNKRGKRFVTATDAVATGFGGNRIIIDDPLSAKDADSSNARAHSIEWVKGTISTRFNNPAEDACVVVHQRLHEDDLTGFFLREQPGVWEHLVLPMRYSKKRMVLLQGAHVEVETKTIKTSLGFVDPRTEEGELLSPVRLDEKTVHRMELSIGAYHTQAQLNQAPVSRGGNVFARKDWKFYRALPAMTDKVLSVDCSFKDTDGSDFVAIQVWGRNVHAPADKYLIHRVKERMGFGATLVAIKAVLALHPDCIAKLIEDKANGTAVIESMKSHIEGIIAIEPEGGKVARAYAVQPQHEAGNLWIPDPEIDPTIETYLTELSAFPNGANDDEADATTQAVNWYSSRDRGLGMLDYYAALSAQANQRKAA